MMKEMKDFEKGQKFVLQAIGSRTDVPRYTLTVRDSEKDELFERKSMAVFVVPLGMEREMEIEHEEIQESVHAMAQVTRLVIVTLSKGHSYEGLEQVKDELNPKIIDIIPEGCTNAG